MTRARHSLPSQIAAVDLAASRTLDPNRSRADLISRQLADATDTLRFVGRYEDVIRKAVAAAKSERCDNG